jgi:putative FmdB family regulatory protein
VTGGEKALPTYDYFCYDCDDLREVRRSMSDTKPVACPKCGGTKMRQAFINAPTTFMRNIDHPDSPLDDLPNAPQMREAARNVVRKTLRDLGHT